MYQKTLLIGRIGQKQLKYTGDQKPVAIFSVATSRSYKDNQSGEWVEQTEWHRLVSFNKCAEHVSEKLVPGDVVQVEGELRTRKWQDKDGVDRFTTEIIVNDFPKKLPRYYNKDGQSASQGQPSQQPQAVGQDFNQPIDAGMDHFDTDDIGF